MLYYTTNSINSIKANFNKLTKVIDENTIEKVPVSYLLWLKKKRFFGLKTFFMFIFVLNTYIVYSGKYMKSYQYYKNQKKATLALISLYIMSKTNDISNLKS